ncbi:MAG: hypothetical protein EPN72_14585 [Nevskiaceae bacterium]|nr:MAG: hypothetical protein EPN63_02450 [Nevskiaceae bacterium]TBR71419.1 MAG: hypothetical protein EPN72_14585 [Nevskiaceae bacterium]
MTKEMPMMPVTTVALIARRPELSPELFSRYWRDVHGVLAARIPGFASYVQHHLAAPLEGLNLPGFACDVPQGVRFDGFAEVGFSSEENRAGLAQSDVAGMIHEDEQNAFRATLLYNLARGAGQTLLDERVPDTGTANDSRCSVVVLLGQHAAGNDADQDAETLWPALARHPGVLGIHHYALASGNPRDWDTPNVAHGDTNTPAYTAIAIVKARSQAAFVAALALACARNTAPTSAGRPLHVYPVSASYVMIDRGQPTLLALRGASAQQTIDVVGARNQCSAAVLEKLYGLAPAMR